MLTLLLGFETPNTALLLISVALTSATPLTLRWHVTATHTLATDEKRLWMRELSGAEVWSAMSEYMITLNLRESGRRRADNAAHRRAVKHRT